MLRTKARLITDRQKEVLFFIADYIETEQRMPTIREIGDKMGIRSLRGVTVHLDALESKGYLQRSSDSRGIVLTAKAGEFVLTETDKRDLMIAFLRRELSLPALEQIVGKHNVMPLIHNAIDRTQEILRLRGIKHADD